MLTDIGVRLLPWLVVTVGDFHAYLTRWCDVLELSTSGQGAIGHEPVPSGDGSVTVLDGIGPWVETGSDQGLLPY